MLKREVRKLQLGELIEIVKQNTEKARWTRGYTYYKKGIVSQAEGNITKGILKIEGVIGSDFSNEKIGRAHV